jgi:hypothetical protein
LRLLITVKAAPDPSARHGETVRVGALSVDPGRRSWIRLYPIHFRDLDDDNMFRKYDIVTVDALPAIQDRRPESWRPIVGTVRAEHHLSTATVRRGYLDPYVEDSMCQLIEHARGAADARSIVPVRVGDVSSLSITRHRGWTAEQQAKINGYLNQLDILVASSVAGPSWWPATACASRRRVSGAGSPILRGVAPRLPEARAGTAGLRWVGSLPFEDFRDRHRDAMERLGAWISVGPSTSRHSCGSLGKGRRRHGRRRPEDLVGDLVDGGRDAAHRVLGAQDAGIPMKPAGQ